MEQTQKYYEKYRPYIEYSGFHQQYHYRIVVENYNNNKTWPLKECPKCSYNLKKDPPISKGIDLEPLPASDKTKDILAVITLFIIPVVLLFMKLFTAAVASVFVILFILLAVLVFKNINKGNTAIFFYYCPNCHELIYNQIPYPIMTKQTPEVVFNTLEQIPGFKLK